MADNQQQQNNNQGAQQASQQNAQANNAAGQVWVNVNTSDSVEAQRMNIMKGNNNELFTKSGR